MQVASQVAALDVGYKPGVESIGSPKLLYLLGAVSCCCSLFNYNYFLNSSIFPFILKDKKNTIINCITFSIISLFFCSSDSNTSASLQIILCQICNKCFQVKFSFFFKLSWMIVSIPSFRLEVKLPIPIKKIL